MALTSTVDFKGKGIKGTWPVWLMEGHVCEQGFMLPAVTENL